jgi:hypothetical protein
MKSVLFRDTGRTLDNGMAERVPETVRSTQGMDIFNANGDVNATGLGFQIATDTLTYIKKQVSMQKFYQVAPADIIPVAVGEGAFAQTILTNLEFSNADDFEKGNIRSGESGARLASADASVASKSVKVVNWAKQIGYSIFDVQSALQANNWDAIAAKERARKKNWDLGLQTIAFLGSVSDTGVTGLLNNANVTINTSRITAALSGLSAANFATFVQNLINDYFTATASTQMPTTFVIPYSDFLGLQTMTPNVIGAGEGTFPITKLAFLLNAFRLATRNPSFDIIPLAYCDAANNASRTGLNKQCYVLFNKDPETIRMDIPVDYTTTATGTVNNFQFQNVAYGQYTGVGVYRNLEVLYFQF